ncbi:MAG: hypothetical protein JNK14_13210 [Chitinophagaceae bacterium]|nr:hypothetical protein [Chitinophagaceae bacterium]
MKTLNLVSADKRNEVPLSQFVERIIEQHSFTVKEQQSIVVNLIHPGLKLNTGELLTGSIISRLIKVMVAHSRYGQIAISAKELYGKMIELNIKDENCCNTYGIALSLQDVVPMAEKAGGRLNILNRKQKITTVSFSFPVVNDKDSGHSFFG